MPRREPVFLHRRQIQEEASWQEYMTNTIGGIF
jgi:hypothetical protein